MKKFLMLVLALVCLVNPSLFANGQNESSSKTQEMTLYIRMMEMQDKWFRENIIKSFEKEYGVKVNVRTFENLVDLQNILELDKTKNTIGLVKVEGSMTYPLAKKDLMMTLEEAVGPEAKSDINEYNDKAVQLASVDGEVYYIPRKLESNTLLYLEPKVNEAVAGWKKYKDQINDMFVKYNSAGLPNGYDLEADPNKWDWYDLAVVSYFWNAEDGEGKMAHRGKKYGGTITELVTKIYQAGGTPEDVMTMNTQPVVDAYEWEVLFKEEGLYNPGMWEEAWSGGGIWNAFASGKVYLAFMNQIDAFFIHGGTHPSMTGYLPRPDEMKLAIMPQGMSLELKDGEPARVGVHGSQLGGWVWGIPKTTPDAELSYALARWITNADNHKNEASSFGMMPVRNDIIDNLNASFDEEWIKDVFDVADMQLSQTVHTLPLEASWAEVGQLYLESWYEIVINGNNQDIQGTLDNYAEVASSYK